jgi:hypothetical protein
MNKYISIFFICLSCSIKINICAQTPYTSQKISITNYLNPANVGFGTNSQLNSFFRNQFAGVGDAYKTIGIAADFKLFKKEDYEPNTFGMGIQAVSERVLNGALQTNYITLNFANRVFLNQLKTCQHESLRNAEAKFISAKICEIYSFGNNVFIKILFEMTNDVKEEWAFSKNVLDQNRVWYICSINSVSSK